MEDGKSMDQRYELIIEWLYGSYIFTQTVVSLSLIKFFFN